MFQPSGVYRVPFIYFERKNLDRIGEITIFVLHFSPWSAFIMHTCEEMYHNLYSNNFTI